MARFVPRRSAGVQLNLGHGRIIEAGRKCNESKTQKQEGQKGQQAWLNDHVNDTYVKLAQKGGYRARAAYKLKKLTSSWPDQTRLPWSIWVHPGAWSQYAPPLVSLRCGGGATQWVHHFLDILPMEPIEGVTFLNGDFREPEVLESLEQALAGRVVDVVVSDMAPGTCPASSRQTRRALRIWWSWRWILPVPTSSPMALWW